MKQDRYIQYIVSVLAAILLSACSNDDLTTTDDSVVMTFRPILGDELGTRSIGDATSIDRLKVVVYEGTGTMSQTFVHTEEWYIAERNGVTLSLIPGHTYKILFWAENKNNTAYTLTEDGKISVDYDDYTDGGFTKMEEMDAFYGIAEVTVSPQEHFTEQICLSRPFAQLNFVDDATKAEQGTHSALITFHCIPTSFKPFTGEVVMTDADNDEDDVTFIFEDFPDESLTLDGLDYYYVSSNYLFASTANATTIAATIELRNADTPFKRTIEFKGEKAITIERNKRTNVVGSLLPTTSTDDGQAEQDN